MILVDEIGKIKTFTSRENIDLYIFYYHVESVHHLEEKRLKLLLVKGKFKDV